MNFTLNNLNDIRITGIITLLVNKYKPLKFLNKRLLSFKYAIQGLVSAILEEANLAIHILIATLSILAGFWFELNGTEWALVLISIGIVISAEIINTAIENAMDIITVEYHPSIKKVKDLAAAAVLVCAFVAALIGIVIFLPKIINLL